MDEEIKLFRALQCCLAKQCKDCQWDDCKDPACEKLEVPRSLLLEALYMLREKNCYVWELLCKIEGLQEQLIKGGNENGLEGKDNH